MYHFQVGSMGAKLLLIYVISQTIITESLGGVTLPCSASIGKVTPIKPKPLSPSTISSLSTLSSMVCESKNKLPSSARGGREFSSPLTFTSTSRALPVPKIDSLSLADVKLPDRLREKFVLPKLCCTTTSYTQAIPDNIIGTPDVSLTYKNAFVSIPSKSSNSLPYFSSWDLSTSSFNKLLSVSSMKSLPVVPIEPFKSSTSDILCPGSLSRSRTIDSPLALETREPSYSEQFSSNTFSSSLPSPLCYKSTYLPGVRTPSEMSPLIFRPISYAHNFNVPSQSGSQNLISPKTVTLQEKCVPCTSRFLSSIKNVDILEPTNPIQLPKTSSNAPISTKPEFLARNRGGKNRWPSSESNSGTPSVALLSSADSKTQNNILINSMPNTLAHQKADFKLKPCTCTPPKIKPPSSFINSPSSPFVPASPLSPTLDVLTNKVNSFDCANNIDIIPIIGACVETIERLDTCSDICSNCQNGYSRYVPTLEQISLSNPFAPKFASYQHSLFSKEPVSKPIYSPPTIPCDPIPTVSSGTSYYPVTSSRISQTPSISYINQSPPISIAQTTSNIVSSINDVVSNIAQKIISSYQSYINPAFQSTPQRPTSTTMQSAPCDNLELISKQTLPVLSLPVSTPSKLPILISPITDCINPPTVCIPTSDASCHLPEYEMAASQSSPISLPAVAILPPISSITYSSPQLCPSYLPSPILPSYPTISSPFDMGAPIYKLSSSKKDSDMEKLIEMMLLAEILNNDESFDWDDLDSLLAFLSLS